MSHQKHSFDIDLPPEIMSDMPDLVAFSGMTALPTHLRVSGLGSLMLLCGADRQQDPELRTLANGNLIRALDGFDQIVKMMSGRRDVPNVHEKALEWMRKTLREADVKMDGLHEFSKKMRGLSAKLQENTPLAPNTVEELMAFKLTRSLPAISATSEALQAAWRKKLDLQQSASMTAEQKATAAAEQIDKITKTVRLISLNAAVEAARAGDAGRGFGVIAQEIKALSEKAETSSRDVQEGIMAIISANAR